MNKEYVYYLSDGNYIFISKNTKNYYVRMYKMFNIDVRTLVYLGVL